MVDEGIEQARQRMIMLTVAFMGALGVYGLLAVQLQVAGSAAMANIDGPVLWVLRGALGLLGLVGVVLADRVTPNRTPGRGLEWTLRYSPDVARACTRVVLRCAFTEAIGVYGLLLFLLGGSVLDAVVFSGVALVVMAVRFPTKERWARERL